MARRKVSNLLALAVLSLLNERPMHPYEIGAVMRQRGLSESIKLNTGSLYSVIEALIKSELIEPVETHREGRHPERTIYTVTTEGRTEFLTWLRSLIRTPAKEYTQFAAGLSFLAHLAPEEAIGLLAERASLVSQEVDALRASIESVAQMVDRIFLIESEYSLTLREAELSWVQKLIGAMRDGTLTDVAGDRMVWKVTHADPGAGL